MAADQIIRDWAARRGLNVKPFADEECPSLVITELRVLLVVKLCKMAPFSLFIVLSFCICFSFVQAGSSCLSVSSGVWRVVNFFCLYAPQLDINPNFQRVNTPLSSEILESTGNCGQRRSVGSCGC